MGRPRSTSPLCPKGLHERTPGNVYTLEHCRACALARALKSQAKRREERQHVAANAVHS
jgi:hypothetical protein